jgi:hypothetical protein
MGGQPDFLELTIEQRDLILKQQKESLAESMSIVMQAKYKDIGRKSRTTGRISQLGRRTVEG